MKISSFIGRWRVERFEPGFSNLMIGISKPLNCQTVSKLSITFLNLHQSYYNISTSHVLKCTSKAATFWKFTKFWFWFKLTTKTKFFLFLIKRPSLHECSTHMFKYKYQYMDFLVVYYIHVSSTSVIVFLDFQISKRNFFQSCFTRKKGRIFKIWLKLIQYMKLKMAKTFC